MIAEHVQDDLPICDVTGEPVDECDHAFPYDEDEEADMVLHQERDDVGRD